MVHSTWAAAVVAMTAALAAELPAVPLAESPSESWWARLDDKVILPPDEGSGLSSNIGDYYYAYGSSHALEGSALKDHRVGGTGRVHLFHLPATSLLETKALDSIGSRRSTMSQLIQLEQGTVLSSGPFPEYTGEADYKSPLHESDQHLEEEAVEAITADSVMQQLTALVSLSDDTGTVTRSWNNEHAQNVAVDFIQGRFEAMGLRTCLQDYVFPGPPSTVLRNVIGYLPGHADATAADGSVTVGAHYDSRPYSGTAPGANDNGSGVAALLAIAKAYTDAKIRPYKPVYFVGFAGEEIGLTGSSQFASSLVDLKDSSLPQECRANASSSFLQRRTLTKSEKAQNIGIIMDEVGWVSTNEGFESPTVNLETYDQTQNTALMEHLVDASKKYNKNGLKVTHSGHPFGSDHMSFLNNGLVGVLVINGDDEAYPNYHQSTDAISSVTGEYLANITKMTMGALVREAGIRTN